MDDSPEAPAQVKAHAPAHAEPLAAPPPRNTWARFAILGALQLMLNASVSVTFAAGPAMQRELGLSRIDLIIDSAAYGLAFSGLLLLGGRLTDRIGQRRLFTRGTALFAVASLAAALAPSSHTVLAARFLQGCGAALAAPAAMALLRVVFPEGKARATALARWGLLASLGAAVGIVLSGALVAWLNWRWSFGLLAAAAVAVLALTPRSLPAGPAPVRVPVDLLGAVLGTLALSTLGYGFVMVGPHGWAAPQVLAPLALGAVLLAVFVAAQQRVRAPCCRPASSPRATARPRWSARCSARRSARAPPSCWPSTSSRYAAIRRCRTRWPSSRTARCCSVSASSRAGSSPASGSARWRWGDWRSSPPASS